MSSTPVRGDTTAPEVVDPDHPIDPVPSSYVVAAVAAWGSNEAQWSIPPVVGVLVAVAGVLVVQRGRRPVARTAA
jgi:hypothetical protein